MRQNKSNFEFNERAYQAHIVEDKISIMRIMCILGTLLYLLFAIVDIWALPSALNEALIIRGAVIFLLLFFLSLTYKNELFVKYYDFLAPIPYLAGSLGIISMIYMSHPDEIASDNYFIGIMLVIMILFSWSHLKPLMLLTTTGAILVMYVMSEIGSINNDKSGSGSYPSLILNIFYLLGTASIGFVTYKIRNDYLHKNFQLAQSLEESLKEKTQEAENQAYLANHDALTGLPNRRYMVELLENSLESAKRKKQILVIMFLDLNGFKQVNDIYGHAVGDEVLNIVAKRLELAIRKGDHVARLGGDEYLMGLTINKDNLKGVEKLAGKFVKLIAEPMKIDGQKIKIGASIGIAAYPIHGNNIEVLLDIADKKMYKVKHSSHRGKSVDFLAESDEHKGLEPVVIFPGYSKKP